MEHFLKEGIKHESASGQGVLTNDTCKFSGKFKGNHLLSDGLSNTSMKNMAGNKR